ncbi:Cytochrome P450 monooxygenase gsfF [Lachnellula arida]|uniref:Cytochrome P450 monooxygenase gsfF n=1 Tax=Lachnellula arida TaxID=1316785 RepID=A0A8T9BNV9_9HELO|nr:Cytochrome P450 monooxygenase gsfF [Lachnellula arida]
MSPIQTHIQWLIQTPPLPLPILLPALFLAISILTVGTYTLYNLKFHPLSAIPGPFLARATPFYPIYLYYHGDFALHMRHLHSVYGEFVRLAPNHIAVSSPTSFKQLWTTKGFEKGDFYDAFALGISKHRDLFTIRQNSFHSQRKRIHGNIWSMTSVLEMEKYIDELIELFLQRMGRLADEKELMDVGLWTWRYTYDIIGELFFGKAYGFLEKEQDIDNLMAAAGAVAPFEGMMGMAPVWAKPFMMWMLAIPNIARGIMNFQKVKVTGKKLVADRMKTMENQDKSGRNDMLGKMLSIVWEKGERVDWTVLDVEQECFVAMVAGNDTVSISLTVILYHLAKNPSSLARLQHDLDEAAKNGALSPTIAYKEAISLPYLVAIINEGFRIHPLFGYPVPRVVPKGGAEVCGRWWPEGTELGTSCGVPEKNKAIFGEDAESWRPERWLVEKEKAARMWDEVCAFGIGSRACIGQHIAQAEMTKLVAQFLLEFNIETASEWDCLERWFNKPQNICIKVTRRNRAT